jgi:cytochrome c2
VQCHGAPGVAPEPFSLALRPLPTPLARSGLDRTPGYLYWVVKHGIKMTGMPAWEFRMDEADLWAVVAFVRHLPTLSATEYAEMRPAQLAAQEPQLGGGPDPQRGKRALEQYACVACHEIPGMVGPEARLGPTLHGIGSRAIIGGVLENTPGNMAQWIVNPKRFAPGTAMPALGVTARDARDIAAHLATLR